MKTGTLILNLPVVLIIAVGIQFLCQAFKLIYYSLRDRKFNIKYAVTSGGMPSSHSAFASALCVSIGLRQGVVSDLFAVAAVFSLVLMYDAMRVRKTVEKQGRLLKTIAAQLKIEQKGEDIPDMVGHSPLEVIVGILIGGGLSLGFTLLLMRAGI